MKRYLIAGAVVLGLAIISYSFSSPVQPEKTGNAINWMTWEDAITASEEEPKKIFIDVYTDWCGWCKKMDKSTFADQNVIQYMNENFYAVKFNAEQKKSIEYRGHTLEFQKSGRRGFHQLAYSLLDGRLSYPSYVYLDEEQNRITISPGFKYVDPFLKELKYIAGNHYETTPFNQFNGE